jgi:hypothetical protein
MLWWIMKVRIFQKPKSAMQSGNTGWGKPAGWKMESIRQHRAQPDALMGWQSSGDTLKTIHLEFDSLDLALDYAQSHGFEATVIPSPARRRQLKTYADNFDDRRKQAWTH